MNKEMDDVAIKKIYTLELMHFIPFEQKIERFNYFNASKEELEKVKEYYDIRKSQTKGNTPGDFDSYRKLCILAGEAIPYLNILKVIKIEEIQNPNLRIFINKILTFRISYFNQVIKNKEFNEIIRKGYIPIDDFINNLTVIAMTCYVVIMNHLDIFQSDSCPPHLRNDLKEMLEYNLDTFTSEQKKKFDNFLSERLIY